MSNATSARPIAWMRKVVVLSFVFGGLLALSRLPAQTNVGLNIALYPGLTISGPVGSNYNVQANTNLLASNSWRTVTNLTLQASPYLWFDTNSSSRMKYYRVLLMGNSNQIVIPSGMALVPAGTFVMGDSVDAESDAPVRSVTVSGFFIDTNLVTYSLWSQVAQWAATNGYVFSGLETGLGPNYPVQYADWYDAVLWCNARSQQAGRTPAYYTDANLTSVSKSGALTIYVNWMANGYRLPTEAEWEKAARGGLNETRFPWGNTISESQANYYGNPFYAAGGYGYTYDQGPTGDNATWYTNNTLATQFRGNNNTVGFFPPNGYGLNDMAGNAFEWCWDWYGAYASGSQTDPRGPNPGTARVCRGGGWNHFAVEARVAARNSDAPAYSGNELSFRTVITQSP